MYPLNVHGINNSITAPISLPSNACYEEVLWKLWRQKTETIEMCYSGRL